MKCLILAAGYATRLYPLTLNFPKPLLKVGEKSILDWLVDDLSGCGNLSEFCIISNHRFAGHFQRWAENKRRAEAFTGKITVLDDGTDSNETRLGAVKDIALALDRLDSTEDILVLAGDNVLDFSLTRFVTYAEQKKTSCVMRYHEAEDRKLQKSGVLDIDEQDRVKEMQEKPLLPKSHWCCPPFYYYTREDAAKIPEGIAAGCGTDAPGSYAAWLCGKRPVHAMEMPGRRYDIGNPESYERVQREYRGILLR